ncbi:MAG: hypothetical protein V7767_08390 [Leeuwenhoekiella sp.]
MENIVIIFTGIAGAITTYLVNNNLQQGAVRASAGLSLLVGLFFYFFPHILNPYLSHHIPIVFIGASFIGMVSEKILSHYFLIALSGCVFAIIYLNTSKFFDGYGGALGTTASIAILVAISLSIVSENKHIKRLRNFRKKNK